MTLLLRYFALCLVIGLELCCSCLHGKPLTITVHSEAALVMNAKTGAILYQKNAFTPYPIASVTKIATALYALDLAADRLDEVVTAEREALVSISYQKKQNSGYKLPAYWLEPDGTHIGIKVGEQLTLKQLLEGLIVCSGNDAGNVIAMYLGGGSIQNFMAGMNAFLKAQGCHKTTFYNPHGLHFPNHASTAYDLAHLMRHKGLTNKLFCTIMAQSRFVRPKTNKQESVTLAASNKLIVKGHKHYYAKAIGGKTGYIGIAQHNFIAVAKEGDRILIAVMLKCKNRDDLFADAKALFEAAFAEKQIQRCLVKAGPQKFTLQLEGASQPLTTYCTEEIVEHFYPAEEVAVKGLLNWRDLTLPIKEGQIVGELAIVTADSNKALHTVTLYASTPVEATWGHWLKSLVGY